MVSKLTGSCLVRFVKVPTTDEVLEDSAIQPLSHLAASTVRTFELVYSSGRTEVMFSAQTVEDMRKYATLLSLVYGELKLEKADSAPCFLEELPGIVMH
jgi:hypothetical protein